MQIKSIWFDFNNTLLQSRNLEKPKKIYKKKIIEDFYYQYHPQGNFEKFILIC